MKKRIVLVVTSLVMILAACGSAEVSDTQAVFVIGDSNLSIHLHRLEHGLILSQIESNGSKLLNQSSSLFDLTIQNSDKKELEINSLDGWAKYTLTEENGELRINFSEPISGDLPQSLKVLLTIQLNGARSKWDYKVSGLAQYSLIRAVTTKLSLKDMANDKFFIPKYSGKLLFNPLDSNLDYELLYPRGWSSSMQYLAYYGNNMGIYLGFHDPKASVKRFFIKPQSKSIDFYSEVIIPDKTVPNNNWEFPGVFELDIFKGDWFDAAMIYKNWAAKEADYWPKMTPERVARQKQLGQVGVWAYYSAKPNYPIAKIEKSMKDFAEFFDGIPVGIHWYAWNYLKQDDNYPEYFPERTGMKDVIERLQDNSNAVIMPYINGRLYDTDLASYKIDGFPDATKDTAGNAFTQDFNGNRFAVMCPTQAPWQRTIASVAGRLGNDLGADGIYIDQVAAAGPVECMDKSHKHSLAGGSWWHDGYEQMFELVHKKLSAGKFLTVEGGNDYLANQVDGFLTSGWLSDNLVPAFQAVYGGRVQLFGKRTGTSEYHKASFFAKQAQAFVSGIQPGRFSSWVVFDSDAEIARPFLKQVATMRYKLREFLAFGSLQRPISLSANIPQIVSTWSDFGQATEVSISMLQSSVYLNKRGDKIAFIFVNASMDKKIDFSFELDGSSYGFDGQLELKRISSTESKSVIINNRSRQDLSLEPLEVVALVLARANTN